MTRDEKINYIWNSALERAIGAGDPTPFDAADRAARKWEAANPVFRPIYRGPRAGGSLAGRRQARERRAAFA